MTGRRRVIGLVALGLALVVAATVSVLALHLGRDGSDGAGPSVTLPSGGAGSPSPSTSPSAPPPTTSAATATSSPAAPPGSASGRRAGLAELLAERVRAVKDHDAAAWLDTVDPKATAFRTRQQSEFANLAALPLTVWHYTVDGAGEPLTASRRTEVGPRAWVAKVTLGYRLGSADRTDVHSAQSLTLVRRKGRWLVAGDLDGHTATEIWDLGHLSVVRGASSIVVGLTSTATLRSYATLADAAVSRVSGVWGSGWPQRVVVLAPATQAQMARLLDEPSASLGQIAAVTTGELKAAAGSPSGGADQVVINPQGFANLGPLGRRVVITHETTHVAVRASTSRGVPIWLSEGFADYVGYDGLGLPATDVAADVLGLVRRGIGPSHLPDEADFDPSQSTIGPAYSSAWLACTLVAHRYGQTQLLALYRATAAGSHGDAAPASPDSALRSAFRSVLGVTEHAFTHRWLAYLSRLSRE